MPLRLPHDLRCRRLMLFTFFICLRLPPCAAFFFFFLSLSLFSCFTNSAAYAMPRTRRCRRACARAIAIINTERESGAMPLCCLMLPATRRVAARFFFVLPPIISPAAVDMLISTN